MLNTTTLTQKGQVTIPLGLRMELGLEAGHKITFKAMGNGKLVLRSADRLEGLRGVFKTKKKYDKKKAREAFVKDLMSGKI